MTDARLVQISDGEAVTLDLLLTPIGDLDTTQELATAVTIALGTDARAKPDDVLPNPNDDNRRGWWGDTEAKEIWDGWPIGCRLWLLSRAKITGAGAREGATKARVEQYIHEALQPFIDRKIATKKTVEVTRNGVGRFDAVVTLFRGPKPAIELRYSDLWNEIAS